MSVVRKMKNFALSYIPGVSVLRDLRRALNDYSAIKIRLEEASLDLKKGDDLLVGAGVNNSKLYRDVISKKFDLKSSFIKYSKSQLDQDLFVAYAFQGKRGGFFVEFGATNGVELSNTFMLESQFNWQGILAEPGKSWHEGLFKNRSCKIDTKCVYNVSGQAIVFADSVEPELSTITDFVNCDAHAGVRKNSNNYEVQTITLNDLLESHDAPKVIDYLSIDTEGSELAILSSFDFSNYDINIITVEHNYTENREKIHELLVAKGYFRVFEEYSQFDDWYVLEKSLGKDVFL